MKKITWVIIAFFVIAFSKNSVAQTSDYATALADCSKKSAMNIINSGCMIGIKAPDFTASTIDRKTVQLSDLKGKVVVLNFWFVACAPCHVEAPVLKKIAGRFEQDNVVFISIARENEADLKKYLDSNQFFKNNIADEKSGVCKNIYHVLGYPTTIVINGAGNIQYYTLGGRVTEEAVEKDLNEKLVPAIKEALDKS